MPGVGAEADEGGVVTRERPAPTLMPGPGITHDELRKLARSKAWAEGTPLPYLEPVAVRRRWWRAEAPLLLFVACTVGGAAVGWLVGFWTH